MKTFLSIISIVSLSLLFSCNSVPENVKSENSGKESSADTAKVENTEKVGFKDQPMDKQTIKELIGFKDKIEEFLCWSDAEGKHIVFTNETGVFHTNLREGGDLYNQNAEVSSYHYIQKPGQKDFEKRWKIFDYSRDCPVDAGATFKKNILQKTDLDNNGIAEIWAMYYTFCKGDVSPSELKIIMYEGNQKYKMSGETKVSAGGDQMYGGEIKSEGDFKSRPEFLKFAKTLWKNNCAETFGE